MIRSFFRAVAQLGDPSIQRIILVTAGGTLLLFLLLLGGVSVALAETTLFELAWLDTTVDLLGGVAAVAIAWLLFPGALVLVAGLFAESVVAAVERRHHPGLPPPRASSFVESAWNTLAFLAVTVALNLAALPLYLVPGVNLFVFPAINGYLLGREYFELVALRHLPPARMRDLRRTERLRLFVAGTIIAFLSLVPIVNLLVPVIATAFMAHVFHDLRRSLPPGRAA